ncbi:MAG: hypothetical protein HFACDABA_00271 [Anaerolineales bacterium]|nr:hypothetical protein [Anaerolineales bacterium]
MWGFWPPRVETRTVAIQFPAGGLSLPGERSLELKSPLFIRAGDSAVAELRLLTEGGSIEADSIFDQYIVIAEARLDLPFADMRPADTVGITLSPGGTAAFYWEIRPREEGILRGEMWVYVRFVPKGGDGEEVRLPLSVQQVTIRSGALWKRTGWEARIAGIVGAIIGLAVGLGRRKRRRFSKNT